MNGLLALAFVASSVPTADWSQFRGSDGRALSRENTGLPGAIDLDRHTSWQVNVPKGHSSPVIVAGRVFLTGFDGEKLWTLAFDERTGRELWRREAPFEKLERVHRVGSPATPTVACDGKRVIAMFGSCGLHCYDLDGEPQWFTPLGPFDNSFGAASSPVFDGRGRVLLMQDHDTGSYLASFDVTTGKQAWRVERPDIRRGYGSPAMWRTERGTEVVVAGSGRVTGYAAENGDPLWTVRGLCRVVSNTPVVGDDGRLYLASTGGGSAPPQPKFADLIATNDANGNGLIEARELPGSPIKSFFSQFDGDKNGSLNEREYTTVRDVLAEAKPAAIAIRPGGTGDVTESHVDWRNDRSIPRNASPLLVGKTLFLVRDGGIVATLDIESGKPLEQARIASSGKIYSSPVAGDGKVYVADDKGVLTVLTAAAEFEELGSVKLGSGVFATPAIANGGVFVRTTTTLFRFAHAKDTP